MKSFLGLLGLAIVLFHPVRPASTQALGVTTGIFGNIASVVLVTVANGGDKIGVYTPSFAVRSGGQVAIIALGFVVMTGLLCMLAHRMVSHPRLGTPLRPYGHVFAPLVLIGLSILIIHNGGSIPSSLGAIRAPPV